VTPEKVLEVIDVYRKFFEGLGVSKIRLNEEQFDELFFMEFEIDETSIMSHCHAMLDGMEQLVKECRMEKCFRWLGFIQGCLLCGGFFTLNELKNHSRPNDETAA